MSAPIERRKVKRREILDHFSFYLQIPKLGTARHKVADVSEMGIGFTIESLGVFTLKKDEQCEINLYLNQSLFLPLKIKVMRQVDQGITQHVGATFTHTEGGQYQTFLTLVKFLDQLVEFGSESN